MQRPFATKQDERRIMNLDTAQTEWLRCPACESKTRVQIREDTELKNFPLYCPKCKQTTLISVKQMNISVITEPVAQTQSR